MKQQKLFQTVFLLTIFLFLGTYSNAQQTFKVATGYYSNGNPKAAWLQYGKKIKKSQMIGYESYYESGKIEEEITKSSNNNTYWVFKSYYPNGKLKMTGNGTGNGLPVLSPEGEWKEYYENGQIKAIGNFNDGLSSGEFKYYYENGQLKMAGERKNSYLINEWKFYNEYGEFIKAEDYGKDGKLKSATMAVSRKLSNYFPKYE